MSTSSQELELELRQRIAELEQLLEARSAERDAAIERQTASTLVNFRLQNELRASLDRQNASAEILRSIATAPGDAEHALRQIAATTARLFGASSVQIQLAENGEWGKGVRFGDSAKYTRSSVPLEQIRVGGRNLPGAVIGENRQIDIPDLDNPDPELADFVGIPHARASGTRTICGTPLRRDGQAIGVLIVYRDRLAPFTPEELVLQQSFADQAVIAIENARLFNHTQEALERETATADVLKVIASSTSDVQPVFEAIAARAKSLVGGFSSTVYRFIDGIAHLMAFTPTTPEADEFLRSSFPRPVAEFAAFRMAQAGEVMQIRDTEDPSYELKDIARARGYRSMLFAPLMNKGVSIGFIAVTRVQTGAFSDHHVQLLKTFADQAVIAIENARLFEEVQARTRDLQEALTHQTGSANILRVIAASPTNVEPVLKAIVESACELCGAYDALLRLKDGDGLAFGAHHGPLPVSLASVPITENSTAGAAVIAQKPVHVHDLLSAEGDRFPHAQALARMHGERTILSVPLLRESESIGAIVLRRKEVHPFTEKQIALLQTFADQAVIAIGNVRLFEQVQEKSRDLQESLQQQTAIGDVLKTISRTTFDLQPVLDTLVQTAARLCDTEMAFIMRREGDLYRAGAAVGYSSEYIDFLKENPIAVSRGTITGRAVMERRTVQILDVAIDPEYTLRESTTLAGQHTALCVPLLRESEPIGTIVLARQRVEPFTQKQIDLVTTFADQAVIAIENVRLFDELRQRTDDLAASLNNLRSAQDRLIQTEKLASLGQLTAGIAHEIKNPLNFINNFAALSSELVDELKQALDPAAFDQAIRAEVDELTGTLADNLQKVVQHGKRADSIVKNMLLHSRQGSGEHRPADVNSLVDESLNLAYHGARAEKPQFNVTVQREFDPNAGTIEAFPQEITRVLLNLISNGFYAVSKRKAEHGPGFEPLLLAATRDRGAHVEIRIRDNGTGIPPEVREQIFNPFFTTKPAGEGTGLGLSMSHDIIVKQHGGTIDVETEPGLFTEFTILLPRASDISSRN